MEIDEAIKNLKKLKSYHNGSYGTALTMAIKALEQTKWNPASENFFKWLALEIMQSDEDFKDNSEAFQEMCCRKLIKLGIIKKETEEGRIIYSLEDFTNEE